LHQLREPFGFSGLPKNILEYGKNPFSPQHLSVLGACGMKEFVDPTDEDFREEPVVVTEPSVSRRATNS
jgi:hypothetical protein